MDAAASRPAHPAHHGGYLTPSEHIAVNHIRRAVHECRDSAAIGSAIVLGRALAQRSLLVTLRTSQPKGFHSLRHQYLLVQTQIGDAAIVVDVEFRDRFYYTGLPGGAYAACVAALPQMFIGAMASLTAIVGMMSDALERDAAAQSHDLPPWRSRRALFANWFPERFTDDVFAPPGAALHPVLLHTTHCRSQSATFQPPLLPSSRTCTGNWNWTFDSSATTLVAGAGADAGAGDGDDQSGGSGVSPTKAHGSKRKAEMAAGGGAPAKAPGHMARSPQAAQQLWAVLQRAESSNAAVRAGSTAPPCVITGFSAPSSLASGAAGELGCTISRYNSSESSSSESSSSESSSSESSSSSSGGGGTDGAGGDIGFGVDTGVGDASAGDGGGEGGCGACVRSSRSCTPLGRPTRRRGSSDGSSSNGGERDGINCPTRWAMQQPAAAATAAAVQRTAHGAGGAAAGPADRRISGLTRKLLESATPTSTAAAAERARCRSLQLRTDGALEPLAVRQGSQPTAELTAAAAVAVWPSRVKALQHEPRPPAAVHSAIAAAAAAAEAAAEAATAVAAAAVGPAGGDGSEVVGLGGGGTMGAAHTAAPASSAAGLLKHGVAGLLPVAASAVGQRVPAAPHCPQSQLQMRPEGWQQRAVAAVQVPAQVPAAVGAAVGAAAVAAGHNVPRATGCVAVCGNAVAGDNAAGSIESPEAQPGVDQAPASPLQAPRLFRWKAAEALPRMFKVRPMGGSGGAGSSIIRL